MNWALSSSDRKNFASLKSAEFSLASLSVVSQKKALVKSELTRLAPLRSVWTKWAPVKSMLTRLESLRLASERFICLSR